MAKTSEKEAQRQEAIAWLRKRLKPGSKVQVLIVKTSRSNMSWHARAFIKGECVTSRVARAIGWPIGEVGGFWTIRGGGVGTCRAFEIGHHLSYALHGYKASDAPSRTIKAARLAEEKARQANRIAREACPRCCAPTADTDADHSDECVRTEIAAREAERGKYRAGYTIKGEWL